MKHTISIIALAAASLALTACSDSSDHDPIARESTMTFTTRPNQWTYISLETGGSIGVCGVSDTAAQQQWAQRKDWDFAICNGMIRTNSGTSGNSGGGIAPANGAYDEIISKQSTQYTADEDTLPVWN